MKNINGYKLFVEIKEPYSSTNREATNEELNEALIRREKLAGLYKQKKEIELQIKQLIETCPHIVSYDTAGYPYDCRSCAGCDKDQGFV